MSILRKIGMLLNESGFWFISAPHLVQKLCCAGEEQFGQMRDLGIKIYRSYPPMI